MLSYSHQFLHRDDHEFRPRTTASVVVQEGLEQRGFQVRRLNTYNTVPVQTLQPADVKAARGASVAAFASPSAVKSWIALVEGQATADVAIACIGM